jgi:hypothetical protein
MPLTPYLDVSADSQLLTVGSNPIPYNYISTAEDIAFYPTADTTMSLGPLQVPQIYAKDLDVLEIASSGQVVMSLQDQASVSFSNNTNNTITFLQGANNNAFVIQPTDAQETTVLGHMTTYNLNDYQNLSTTESNGFRWSNPVKVQSTLDVYDGSTFKKTLDVSGATTLWSTLSVYDRVTLSSSLTVVGNATFNAGIAVSSNLTVSNGHVSMQSSLSVNGTTRLQSSLDVCGEAVLSQNLSVVGAMNVGDVNAGSIQVGSIQSTGTIAFAQDVIMLKGLDISGGVNLASSLSVYDAVTFQSSLDVSGATRTSLTLSVAGTTLLQSSLQVTSATTLSGPLSIAATLSIGGALSIGSSIDVLSSTLLRNSLSVADNLYVVDRTNLASTLSVQGSVGLYGSTTDVSGVLRIGNDLLIPGNLSVNESTYMDSSLAILKSVFVGSSQPNGTFLNSKFIWINNGSFFKTQSALNYSTWTMTMWVKVVSQTNAGLGYFIDSRPSTSTPEYFIMTSSNAGAVLNVGGNFYSSVLADHQWHFLTIITDNTSIRVYEDGTVLTPKLTVLPSQVASYGDLRMLHIPSFGMPCFGYTSSVNMNASFDEIAVFDSVLTTTQIASIYNNGLPGNVLPVATPKSLWRMESLTGAKITDEGINANHLRYFITTTETTPTLSLHSSTGAVGAGTDSLYSGVTLRNMYLTGQLDASDDVWVDGSANLQDNTYIDANLSVDASSFFVEPVVMHGELDVSGAMRVKGTLSVHSSVLMRSTLLVNGDTDIYGSLDVSANLTARRAVLVSGLLSVASTANFTDTLDVAGATRLWSTLSVSAATTLNSSMTVDDPAKLASSLTQVGGGSVSLDSSVRLASTLSVHAETIVDGSFDVSGATRLKNTLLVAGVTDICGNVRVVGTATVQQSASFNGPAVLSSSLTVQQTATINNGVYSDVYRPLSGTNTFMTIDASKTIINGNVDILGTINTINNVDAMMVQDKNVRMAYNPDGGAPHVDGTFVNHQAGLYVDGLPANVATDPQRLYEKSFSWQYDNLNGTHWSALGSNSADNTVLPREPAWSMRGGAFKMANYRDASNGSMFTMRINAQQEFEVWRSLLVNDAWVHTRVTRFGATKTVAPISVITAFTATLGDPTQSTTSLSLKITSVTDTLYSSKGIIPYYTVTQVQVLTDAVPAVAYPTLNGGISIPIFAADATGTVPNAVAYDVSGLPANTMFTKVRARLENQFGVVVTLESTVTPGKPTLDASGPQVVGSLTVAPSATVTGLDVTIASYDVGLTTSTYTGVLFASKLSTYDTSSITASTPNVQYYTGDGKTQGTADTESFTILTDVSGAPIASGSYYVYYVLYDPLGNRTTNDGVTMGGGASQPSGPHTIAEVVEYYNNFRSIELAGDSTNNQYSEVLNWAPATTNGVTVSAWVYTKTGNTTPNWIYAIGDKNAPSSNAGAWLCGIVLPSGQITSYIGGAPPYTIANFTPTVSIFNEWHHLTFTYNPNNGLAQNKIYLDGVLVATVTDTTAIKNMTSLHVSVGRRWQDNSYTSNTEWFKGSIDEMSIFNTVLTATEVNELYNNGLPPNVLEHSRAGTTLQAYWQMQDFNGTQHADKSGYGRHLTINYSGTKVPQMTSNTPNFAVNTIGRYAPSMWNATIHSTITPNGEILIVCEFYGLFTNYTIRSFETSTYTQIWQVTQSTSYAVSQLHTLALFDNLLIVITQNGANIYKDRFIISDTSCTRDATTSVTTAWSSSSNYGVVIRKLDTTGKYIISSGTNSNYHAKRYYSTGTLYDSLNWSNPLSAGGSRHNIQPIAYSGSGWDCVVSLMDWKENYAYNYAIYYIFDSTTSIRVTGRYNSANMSTILNNCGISSKGNIFWELESGNAGIFYINGITGNNTRVTSLGLDWYTGAMYTKIVPFKEGLLRFYASNSTDTRVQYILDQNSTFTQTDAKTISLGEGLFLAQNLMQVKQDSKYVMVIPNNTTSAWALNLQKSIVFNTVGTKATRGTLSWVPNTQSFSFSCWAFFITPASASSMRLMTCTDSARTMNRVRLHLNYTGTGTDTLAIYNRTSTGGGEGVYIVPTSNGGFWRRWHHIVGIWTNTSTVPVLYINGVIPTLQSSIARNSTENLNVFDTTHMFISEDNTTSPCNGYFSEMVWYDTTLTQPQITTLYNNGIPPDPRTLGNVSNVTVYIKGDTLTPPNVLEDLTGNLRNMTLNVSDANYSALIVSNPNMYRFTELKVEYEPDVSDGLLDVSGAVGVYGLRKIVPSYTGPIVRVQRSNDSGAADVYMDAFKNVTQTVLVGTPTILTPHNITTAPTLDAEGYYVFTSPLGVTQRMKASTEYSSNGITPTRPAWQVFDGTTTWAQMIAANRIGWMSAAGFSTGHLILDLGQTYSVTTIKYYGYGEDSISRWPTSYSYYASSDGINWAPAFATRTGITNGQNALITDNSPIITRYLKLEYTQTHPTETVVGINELEVVGFAAPSIPLTPHNFTAPLVTPRNVFSPPSTDICGNFIITSPHGITQRIRASSTEPSRNAWKVFDGTFTYSSTSLGWSSAAGVTTASLFIDLGARFRVTQIRYWGYGESSTQFWPSSYVYSSSEDNSTWTSFASQSNITLSQNASVQKDTYVSTRYLQLQFTTVGGTRVGINELEIVGVRIDDEGYYLIPSPISTTQRIKASNEKTTRPVWRVLNGATTYAFNTLLWQTDTNITTGHIIYDLSAEYTVTSISFNNLQYVNQEQTIPDTINYAISYTFYKSNDGISWTQYTTRSNVTSVDKVTDTTQTISRFLKLEFVAVNGSTVIGVGEIEINGYQNVSGTIATGATSFTRWAESYSWNKGAGILTLTSWYDQTGAGKHLNQALVSYPVTNSRLSNVYFDGTTTNIYINQGLVQNGSSNYSYSALWNSESISTNSLIVGHETINTDISNKYSSIQTVTSEAYFCGGNNDVAVTPALASKTWYRTICQVNNTHTRNIEFTINGSTYKTATQTPSALNIASDRFLVGCRNRSNVNSLFLKGNVQEILVNSSSITTEQQAKIETLWSKSWLTYNPFNEYDFIVSVQNDTIQILIDEISIVGGTMRPEYFVNCLPLATQSSPIESSMSDGLKSSAQYAWLKTNATVGTLVFKLRVPVSITVTGVTVTYYRPIYRPGWKILKNGVHATGVNETANGGTSQTPENSDVTHTFTIV